MTHSVKTARQQKERRDVRGKGGSWTKFEKERVSNIGESS